VKFSGGFSQVGIARDVVAIEHAAGLVSTDLHRHGLPYPRANQISHGALSEIVPDHSRQACLSTGRQPGFSKVSKPGTLKSSFSWTML
jgi:hypothetical protein